MTRIISIANQKGGVGKTTTAVNLSGALSSLHKSVLVIDMDPQGNAGRGLGVDINAMSKTIFDCLVGDLPMDAAIVTRENPRIDIIPSNLKLASLDAYIQNTRGLDIFHLLSKAFGSLSKAYDFIVIDCPPSLGLLSLNALIASDSVIIPVQCEYFAMEAVGAVLSTVKKVQSDYNEKLKIEGFLLTMYDPRTTLGTEVATQVRGLFKENTFVTSIPRNVSLSEASAQGEPVTSWRPNSQGAQAYFALAREVIDHERR
jgi:chromosome partitioning protein